MVNRKNECARTKFGRVDGVICDHTAVCVCVYVYDYRTFGCLGCSRF